MTLDAAGNVPPSSCRIPLELLAELRQLDPTDIYEDQAAACAAGAFSGSYLLVVQLRRGISVAIRGAIIEIEPGWHLYSGSAYGPGGIRARVVRHFRPAKKVHWHIDHLTNAGTVAAVMAFADGNECSIVERLLVQPFIESTLAGFGSSDCSNCMSHLLSYRPMPARVADGSIL